MDQSIEFKWNPDEFRLLVESCRHNDGVQLSLKYMPRRDFCILEAGCGSGSVVKYFSDPGYTDVTGIELNKEIVRVENEKYPELKIRQGDILTHKWAANSFDIVVSYGVIEHFPAGEFHQTDCDG